MNKIRPFFLLLVNLLFYSIILSKVTDDKIIVGTKIAEPFVIQSSDGSWNGISFELWNNIAKDLNIEYEVRSYNLENLIKAVANNKIDIAVSPLTITSEREKLFDFTHAYYTTGLSIAVKNKSEDDVFSIVKNIFSIKFVKVVLLIILVLFAVGFIVWLFERKKNADEFGDGLSKGLGSSFWWAAVTMTTVGYGDKSPKTFGGRAIALVWMFAGLIIISGFTAAIASALTVKQLDVGINSPEDLYEVRVGTVRGSSSEEYLTQNGYDFITVSNIEEGISGVRENRIDAFVYDAPILKYYIKTENISNEVQVLSIILDPINYAFALPTNSPYRELINRVLLREIDKNSWTQTINSYIGR